MATDDFEAYRGDDDDDLQGIYDTAEDLKKEIGNYKNQYKSDNVPSKATSSTKNSGKTISKESGKQTAKETGKHVAKETGKQTTKEASKKATKKLGKKAAQKAGKAAAKETAKVAADKVAGKATNAHPIAKIIYIAVKLITKINKFLDKKAEEHGISFKGIRALFAAWPILSIFVVIYLVLVIIMLLSQFKTYSKVDALKMAIECAENEGCSDFLGTGLVITSARVPLGPIGTTIAQATGKALDAADSNNQSGGFASKLNQVWDMATSQKLIQFQDLQIAKFVVEYMIFDKVYFGVSDLITDTFSDATSLMSEGDDNGIIEWIFGLLKKYGVLNDVKEAYSLYNWLRLEKIAFNRIKWQIYYTGLSGTGNALIDDMLGKFCKDTEKKWWRIDALDKFCDEERVTPSITFKVLGDVNPLTANLWVPTDIFSLGDSVVNSLIDVEDIQHLNKDNWFGDFLGKINEAKLPDEDKLIEAVSEFLPSWIEIYSAYVDSGDLNTANRIYRYYLNEIKAGGEFGIKVDLYLLRNYNISKVIDEGDPTTTYYIKKDKEVLKYGLSEAELQEYLNDSQVDEERKEGDKTIVEKVWQGLKAIGAEFEKAVREFWHGIKSTLSGVWYYMTNNIANYIYANFPLTFAADRHWAICVTKGSAFDAMYDWKYAVETTERVEVLSGKDADLASVYSSEGPTKLAKFMDKIASGGTSSASGDRLIADTIIAREKIKDKGKVEIHQKLEMKNIKREVTYYDESLNMTSSNTKEYKLNKTYIDFDGKEFTKEIKCDNRLAYVIEKISEDKSNNLKYNSDDFAMAYEMIRAVKGMSYLYGGIYADYSTLTTGAFGWPLVSDASNSSISSCYGKRRHPVTGEPNKMHNGLDIAAPANTKILAAKAGKVILNKYNPGGYGYYVILKHDEGWYTLYAHMIQQSKLAVGDEVAAGQVIGFVGTTGRSTGNHLHFEIAQDPKKGDDYWSAERKDPVMYIVKSTFPEGLEVYGSNCTDKSTWGAPDYLEPPTVDAGSAEGGKVTL